MSDRTAVMQSFVDAHWPACRDAGSSWIGFYVINANRDAMDLGPCRDSPACSPIGLHGMCGRSWTSRRRLIIPDVHAHGDGHIVCDPRNLSELVIPLMDESGSCWGVFDADSHTASHYTARDVRTMTEDLIAAGLTNAATRDLAIEVVMPE